MKILAVVPSDMLIVWYLGSLTCLSGHDVAIHFYDKHGSPSDGPILDAVDREKPDVVTYVGQAGGPWMPSASTFCRIRDRCPTIHVCFDAYDSGWDGLLTRYKEKQCFTVTIATDGGNSGPVDYISYHPVDPRFYPLAHQTERRPIALGTCGGFPYGLRREVMTHLQKTSGLYIKPREEHYDSYQRYANFLMSCEVVVDCALSAGGHSGQGPYARTLKTRAIEVGLAGACLLELRGCALSRWATEDVDYATYETPEEAADVYADLKRNPEKARTMALQLQGIVRNQMNPQLFWDEAFRRCGL